MTIQQVLEIPGLPEIYLRLTGLDDIGPLYEVADENRKYLQVFQPSYKTLTAELSEKKTRDNVKKIQKGEFLQYRIISKSEPKHNGIIGTVTFHNKQKSLKLVFLGYWLAEAFQGKGYALAAVNRALKYVFEEWGMDEVLLEIQPENTRSEKLAGRLGAWDTGIISSWDQDGQANKSKVWVISKL